jgi:hypothetical protein
MRYRKLTPSKAGSDVGAYDYTFGRGKENFWVDVPDAVGQAVLTRLKLETGQWFLDREDGTPWNTRVLGKYTGSTRDPTLRARILDTNGVNEIIGFSSSVNPETRDYSVVVVLDTIYGRTTPTNIPA